MNNEPKARVIGVVTKEADNNDKGGARIQMQHMRQEVVVTSAGEGELVCCGQTVENIDEGFECK